MRETVFIYRYIQTVWYSRCEVKIMKKLFISQPMRGKTDEEILAVREKAIKSAEKQVGEHVEVIDSFFQSAPVDTKPL